MIVTEYNNI